MTVIKNKTVLFEGHLKGNLYIVTFYVETDTAPTFCFVLNWKQTRLSYHNLPKDRKATRILEVMSTDVCGLCIDHFSHFSVCYLLSQKSQVFGKFKENVAMIESKFNKKLHLLRCDNGGEYSVSVQFKSFCKTKGLIVHTVA